jgi:hypothetical protein
MRSLVGKFLSNLSAPITDHAGDIYLYKGDGLIAVWNWAAATEQESILRSVDAMYSAIERQRGAYHKMFGVDMRGPGLAGEGADRVDRGGIAGFLHIALRAIALQRGAAARLHGMIGRGIDALVAGVGRNRVRPCGSGARPPLPARRR